MAGKEVSKRNRISEIWCDDSDEETTGDLNENAMLAEELRKNLCPAPLSSETRNAVAIRYPAGSQRTDICTLYESHGRERARREDKGTLLDPSAGTMGTVRRWR